MIRRFVYPIIAVCSWLLFVAPASANDSSPFGHEVVEFFNLPKTGSARTLDSEDAQNEIVLFVEELGEAVFSSDQSRLTNILSKLDRSALLGNEDWAQTIAFGESVLSVFETSEREDLKTSLLQFLENYNPEDNWYLQSTAHSLSAYLLMSMNQLLAGTEHADKALEIIPSKLSAKVTAARIMASDAAMLLNGLQGKPEFMLDAAILQKEARATIGEDLNRYELMTNFVFAFNRGRDYESAALVADLLLAEPRPEGIVPGVAEAYMAATFNEIGNYSKAETLARTALRGEPHPVVEQRGSLELLVALAGQGKRTQAEVLMSRRDWKHGPDALLETVTDQSVLHAEALLAMHRNEAAFSLALMKRRADILINQIQAANSADISGMLSNLENTRERQMEREGALQREAKLKAVQLEQQNRLNRLLWILIGVLTLAFNLLLAFLRYREINNRKVRILQEDALSAEKMKTEFLGVINHELRTPLNGIIGISDAMIHHAEDPALQDQARIVQESGQLLHDLLDSLITMSTIEGDRLNLDENPVELAALITREVSEWTHAASDQGLTFTHFVGSGLHTPVEADAKRLRQCLRYLLSNAMRFTHEGRVHLHATAERSEDGRHSELKIVVADTGQGISEAVQARMFKPFLQADTTMTRKYGGAGLSLAIARKLARMMGGDLTVNSREGRGSEFTFTARLPYEKPINTSATEPTPLDDATVPAAPLGKTLRPSDLTPPDLTGIEDPEAIIDLMLDMQLTPSDTAEDNAQRDKTTSASFKATG